MRRQKVNSPSRPLFTRPMGNTSQKGSVVQCFAGYNWLFFVYVVDATGDNLSSKLQTKRLQT